MPPKNRSTDPNGTGGDSPFYGRSHLSTLAGKAVFDPENNRDILTGCRRESSQLTHCRAAFPHRKRRTRVAGL